MFSQEPNGKRVDGPSDSLCGGLRERSWSVPRRDRRPGVGVGEDRDGFLGEKSSEIGRAAQGRFPEMGGGRKEEIGSR